MALEIERKFLVLDKRYQQLATPSIYKQAYLNTHPDRTVRVRIVGEQAFLTIKTLNQGISRQEFEYPIPVDEAEYLLGICENPPLEKWRYCIPVGDHIWEVDEFLGVNQGLVLAEIELASEDSPFTRPEWIGKEVSDDPRYYNSYLSKIPFSHWNP